MANQGNPICKCKYTKVDVGIKKSNRAKTGGWDKSSINEKSNKEDRRRLV